MSPSPDRLGPSTRRQVSGTWPTTLMLSVSAALLLAVPTTAQQDPVNNFCRRFGHQTAVVDEKLYIDGGFINWDESPSNFSNPYFLYNDLSQSAPNVNMPPLYANLSKNGTIPSTNGGALWTDSVNKRIYLFGGEHSMEPPWAFNLWGYDILNNQWDSFGAPRSGIQINRVSYGAGASVDERGEGYYYGGWLNNATTPGWGNAPPVATSGLVKYSMDTNSWTNNTGGPDNVRRAEGSLQYIPAAGGGMLVYFGGIQDLYANGTITGQPMDQIFTYDILSSRWITQKATGQVPDMRRRFCAGVTWAADKSSYNVYLYGGAPVPGALGAGFDDIYVLTMPSFAWIKMFPSGNGTGANPHHSLSCNIVAGGSQMIIIGGTFPSSSQCDYPVQWGTHNADLGRQNKNKNVWDLYSPNKTTYVVPDDILAVVGGNGQGGATVDGPAAGWDNPDLGSMMNDQPQMAVRKPTREVSPPTAPPSSKLSTGATAGIAVGGAVFLLALAVACLCLVRKRRGRRYRNAEQQKRGPFQAHSMSEAWSPPTTQLSPVASPYSPPYGYSPFTPPPLSPPPPQSAQTVPPHMGPPVELPSESPALTTNTGTPGPGTSGTTTTTAAAASETTSRATTVVPPSLVTRASSVTYPPQQAYFPEPVTLSNQVQVDAHGNMWVPQVSMVQVASGSSSHNGTPPVYTPPTGDVKSPVAQPTPPVEVQPTPPAELPTSPQELSADPDERDGQRKSRHQTFYHR